MLRRTVSTYRSHDMTDRAASLTYFGMLSLFPGLLTMVSLLTIFGPPGLASAFAGYLRRNGVDATTANAVQSALTAMQHKSSGAAGLTLVIGLGLGLNGASG